MIPYRVGQRYHFTRVHQHKILIRFVRLYDKGFILYSITEEIYIIQVDQYPICIESDRSYNNSILFILALGDFIVIILCYCVRPHFIPYL